MKHIVSSPSRTEQVYEQLKHSIADCSLAPGSHLIQEELANIFAVSRQPIQQALVLLKNDGLVVEHGARGLYVTPLDKDETIDRYDIRLLLDRFSIMQVCAKVKADTNFKDVVRRSLSKILDEGKDALNSSNVSDAVEHDIAFHTAFYDLSGNSAIGKTAAPHWVFLKRVMHAVLLHAERGMLVWEQHNQILEAAIQGDEEKCNLLVRDHVLGAQQALFAAIDSSLTSKSMFSFEK